MPGSTRSTTSFAVARADPTMNNRGRIALIGGNGQLGSDLTRIWADSKLGRGGMELISLTHAEFEVTDQDRVRSVLSGIQPSLVINTAAFHRVDDCEKQAMEAFAVNGL